MVTLGELIGVAYANAPPPHGSGPGSLPIVCHTPGEVWICQRYCSGPTPLAAMENAAFVPHVAMEPGWLVMVGVAHGPKKRSCTAFIPDWMNPPATPSWNATTPSVLVTVKRAYVMPCWWCPGHVPP